MDDENTLLLTNIKTGGGDEKAYEGGKVGGGERIELTATGGDGVAGDSKAGIDGKAAAGAGEAGEDSRAECYSRIRKCWEGFVACLQVTLAVLAAVCVVTQIVLEACKACT